MAHLPLSHEWKSMSPCVVLAEKLGAMLPNRSRGCSSAAVASPRQRKGEIGGRAARREAFRAVKGRGAERMRKKAIVTCMIHPVLKLVKLMWKRRVKNDHPEAIFR